MQPPLSVPPAAVAVVLAAVFSGCSEPPSAEAPEENAPVPQGVVPVPEAGATATAPPAGEPAPEITHLMDGSPAHGWADLPAANEWDGRYLAATTDAEKIETLAQKQASGPEMLGDLVRRALRDPSEPVRVEGVQVSGMLEHDEAAEVLGAAIYDTSPEVRAYALEAIFSVPDEGTQIGFFGGALGHPLRDVRDTAILELGRFSTKPAFETMLEGLKSDDPGFRGHVMDELRPIVEQAENVTFGSYEQAAAWWEANKESYDERLTHRGEP